MSLLRTLQGVAHHVNPSRARCQAERFVAGDCRNDPPPVNVPRLVPLRTRPRCKRPPVCENHHGRRPALVSPDGSRADPLPGRSLGHRHPGTSTNCPFAAAPFAPKGYGLATVPRSNGCCSCSQAGPEQTLDCRAALAATAGADPADCRRLRLQDFSRDRSHPAPLFAFDGKPRDGASDRLSYLRAPS
jgi:hypothetical protein